MRTKIGNAGQPLPAGAIPADDTFNLTPVAVMNQRRHRFNIVFPRPVEFTVINHMGNAGWKLRIVLRYHAKIAPLTGAAPHFVFDQHASLAGALGEYDQTVAYQ